MRLQAVISGTAPELSDAEARLTGPVPTKSELSAELDRITEHLDALQRAVYAEGTRALLVVLQGRDASGKDGTVRKVFGPLDQLGVVTTSFKAPTPLELSHDYLWRVHHAMPARGMIGVFNRSHYEDVLVVRVRRLVPEAVWRPRYEQINLFERILVENGTVILKFMLHISREAQRDRLLERLEDPEKYWKFNAGDLEERALWNDYTAAYREMLQRTSTAEAPWFVVPADEKRVRDVLIARVVADTLERLNPRYPGPPAELDELRKTLKADR